MLDMELVQAFLDGTLDPERFHHRQHVMVVWAVLERHSALVTLELVERGLRRLAAAVGKPGLYHETITWAYVLLVQQRRLAGPPGEAWDDFAERNGDLLRWNPSVLDDYYEPETLASERARRIFVLPDRGRRPNAEP